jgi:hypothetical protein
MKKFPAFLLTLVLLVPAALSAAASFEGSMQMQMISGKEKPLTMDYLIKKNRARVTPQLGQKEGSMAMIIDYDKLEILTLMIDQKMYLSSSIKSLTEAATGKETGEQKFTLEKTGVKEKILGYNCEKYLMKTTDSNTEMWLTEDLGTFVGIGTGAGGMGGGGRRAKNTTAQAWEKALAGKNMFPLRVVVLTPNGKESSRMEVTAIKKESVPESTFTIPADFQKLELPPMGDMMKGMMKGLIPGR